MKKLGFLSLVIGLSFLFMQCEQEDMKNVSQKTFTIKVENISTNYDYFAAGADFIPDGETEAGPAFPGQSFTIEFHAGKNHKLSFASMFGASNDLLYGTADGGIALFDGDTPLTGDITSLISLWDAGTEVNHAPGSKEDGDMEDMPVQSVRNMDDVMDGFDYNNVEDNIQVMLDYDGTSMFTLTIHVLSTSQTPLSPIAWVIHSDGQKPIFTEGMKDYGYGLEDLAETGNAEPLSTYLEMKSGYVSPTAPIVWAIHSKGVMPIFEEGQADYGNGLETLAETGDPSMVYDALMTDGYTTGVQNIPDGETEAGPIFPGQSFTFSFDAKEGDYLSLAFMLGKSNDEFFAFDDTGLELFSDGEPISGDITSYIRLWDAGTEPNEYPGAGIHQGAGGNDENGEVMLLNDSFDWPGVSVVIKVTITASEP